MSTRLWSWVIRCGSLLMVLFLLGGELPTYAAPPTTDDRKRTRPSLYPLAIEASVPRSLLIQLTERPTQTESTTRIVPAFRNGRCYGFRLAHLREGSFFKRIGLRVGDILSSVEGFSLHSLMGTLKAFQKLRGFRRNELRVQFFRGEREGTLHIEVTPKKAFRFQAKAERTPSKARLGHVVRETKRGHAQKVASRQRRKTALAKPPSSRPTALSETQPTNTKVRLLRIVLLVPTSIFLGPMRMQALRSIRFGPARRGFGVDGLRLLWLRNGSTPAQLGLKKGDLVLSLNDQPVFPMKSILLAYRQLKVQRKGTWKLRIVRAGKPFELVWKFWNDAPTSAPSK